MPGYVNLIEWDNGPLLCVDYAGNPPNPCCSRKRLRRLVAVAIPFQEVVG
jgi:hypothetical protein